MADSSPWPLALMLLVAACAVPVPPTGGPADQQPPRAVSFEPEPGSVSVSTDRVRIRFDEFLDERSGAAAVTVTPASDVPPRVRVSGREIVVSFQEPLRENTTYIVTVDAALRDAHSVALAQPITMAFSTGPEINRGRLTGRVLDADTGAPVGGIDLFAYLLDPTSDSTFAALEQWPERPDYRTQSGQDGTFAFSYLARAGYFVAAFQDVNRSRVPDTNERFALPPDYAIVADSVAAPATWFAALIDREPPAARRVLAESDRRVVVRFSENVTLLSRNPGLWVVGDSAGTPGVETRAVFRVGSDRREVILHTAPMTEPRYWLHYDAVVADSSGNPSARSSIRFDTNPSLDSLGVRFVAFLGDTLAGGIQPLAPGTSAGVRFSAPPDSALLAQALILSDSTGAARPVITQTDDGTSIFVASVPPIGPGKRFTLRLEPPLADSVLTVRYRQSRPGQTGELAGVVSSTGDAVVVVELIPSDPSRPRRKTSPGADGRFLFAGLPQGGTYRIRAFEDRDGNGQWDPGTLYPFTAAEPLAWTSDVPPVRARWENVVADTLRIVPAR